MADLKTNLSSQNTLNAYIRTALALAAVTLLVDKYNKMYPYIVSLMLVIALVQHLQIVYWKGYDESTVGKIINFISPITAVLLCMTCIFLKR